MRPRVGPFDLEGVPVELGDVGAALHLVAPEGVLLQLEPGVVVVVVVVVWEPRRVQDVELGLVQVLQVDLLAALVGLPRVDHVPTPVPVLDQHRHPPRPAR